MTSMENKCFSFDKHAKSYAKSALIQEKIAKILVEFALDSQIRRICDFGAGSGNVAKNINKIALKKNFYIDYFLGIDNAPNMLLFHPKKLENIETIELLCLDFNLYEIPKNFDLIISSSALHWANNLESMFVKISNLDSKKIAFSIFTNNSLASLHGFLSTRSPLLTRSEIVALINKYFSGEIFVINEKEHFNNPREMLENLRNSGLLGGNRLTFAQKKQLKFECEIDELEYEVVCFSGKRREND